MKIIDANQWIRVIAMVAERSNDDGPVSRETISYRSNFRRTVQISSLELRLKENSWNRYQEFDGYGEVKRIFVHPKSRGNGVATAILNRLEREARVGMVP